jgi:superfamily I DNA/RNA helicase
MAIDPPLTRGENETFSGDDVAAIEQSLAGLANDGRVAFRNRNAALIAGDASTRMLVVAGPGAGKSFLLMDRIRSWLEAEPAGRIHVASFVRKLVSDLRTDVQNSEEHHRRRVSVSTLHSLARSLIERNGGSSSLPLEPYVRIISGPWEDMVWEDVWSLGRFNGVSLDELKSQFHNDIIENAAPWPNLRADYFRVCRYYNAVGFADSVVLAKEAVLDNPELVERDLWIFDEFQDFNRAEEHLIEALTADARGVLLAGDDDQALYQQLKEGHPEIIRGYFRSTSFAKALLPFCSRCSFHIALAALDFLKRHQDADSIQKVFLPLVVDEAAARVQVVAVAHPNSAASYVEAFVEAHRDRIDERHRAIQEERAKDPYLLILSFSHELAFLGERAAERIEALAKQWELTDPRPGPDFVLVLLYARAAKYPRDNFTFRKVLHFEGVAEDVVHGVLARALKTGKPLSEEGAVEFAEPAKRCAHVLAIVEDAGADAKTKAERLAEIVILEDVDQLALDLEQQEGDDVAREDEEEVFTPQRLAAVEILSMAGAKGLSADHVIVLGCDQLNMAYATPQLFFVTLTRARETLHLLTSLKARGSSEPHAFLGDLSGKHCTYLRATQVGMEELSSFSKLQGWLSYLQKSFSARRRR